VKKIEVHESILVIVRQTNGGEKRRQSCAEQMLTGKDQQRAVVIKSTFCSHQAIIANRC
jgi:hypothetical protein